MNLRLFRFHLITLLVAVWTAGGMMAIQFYRVRAMDLDAPLEMFAKPARTPNPHPGLSSFGYYEEFAKGASDPARAAREAALLKELKFEVEWRRQPWGFLLPMEWLIGISVPLFAALITEYHARRRDARKRGSAGPV